MIGGWAGEHKRKCANKILQNPSEQAAASYTVANILLSERSNLTRFVGERYKVCRNGRLIYFNENSIICNRCECPQVAIWIRSHKYIFKRNWKSLAAQGQKVAYITQPLIAQSPKQYCDLLPTCWRFVTSLRPGSCVWSGWVGPYSLPFGLTNQKLLVVLAM